MPETTTPKPEETRKTFPITEYVHPMSPFRTPHWRWQQSEHCLDGPAECYHYTDKAILNAAAFRWRRAQGEKLDSHPIAIALAIRTDNNAQRWELEARLLARETPTAIAAKMKLTPATIEAYADLFFDLPPEGCGKDWLLIQVFHLHGTPLRDPTELECWRWLAWHLGPCVVDLLVDEYRSGVQTKLGRLLRGAMQIAAETFWPTPPSEKYLAIAEELLQRLEAKNDDDVPTLRAWLKTLCMPTEAPAPATVSKTTRKPETQPETQAESAAPVQCPTAESFVNAFEEFYPEVVHAHTQR